MRESELINIKLFVVTDTLKISQKKYSLLDYILKTIPWTYKIKELNRKKNNGNLLWKRIVVEYIINELLSKTRVSY